MGDARAFFGLLRFSKISAAMCESRFSHTGMIIREKDGVFVYDMMPSGARRISFGEYLIEDRVEAFAIKRAKHEYRDKIPQAIAFCRKAFEQRIPFDKKFRPDNGRFYCSELTEASYRSAGQALSEPVRIDCFPRFHEYPLIIKFGRIISSLRPSQRVFLPGNESMGIWACPELDLVFEATDPYVDCPPASANRPMEPAPSKLARTQRLLTVR